MASAKVKNFDYFVEDGYLRLVSGPEEVVSSQVLELHVNEGEWFLGTDFGYPWFIEGKDGLNVGLLGSVFNRDYISAILSKKISQNENVLKIDSIDLKLQNNHLVGKISETLRTEDQSRTAVYPTIIDFKVGGF